MPHQDKPLAFTIKFNKSVRELTTPIHITEPNDTNSGGDAPESFEFKAVWDTGATSSVITQKVIATLGIQKIDEIDNYTANGERIAGVYLVDIILPNKVVIPAIRVIDGDILDTDVLIGMDIISQGDLAITHKFNNTWMTFQMPASHKIDFVNEINIQNGKPGFRKPKKRKQSRTKKRKRSRK